MHKLYCVSTMLCYSAHRYGIVSSLHGLVAVYFIIYSISNVISGVDCRTQLRFNLPIYSIVTGKKELNPEIISNLFMDEYAERYPVRQMIIRNTLQWRHNERDGVSNHQPHHCLLSRLFKAQIQESIKAPRHWPLCGDSPVTGEFPAQRTSNVENVSIWWRHHASIL